jgi:RHS repeat-associated protein
MPPFSMRLALRCADYYASIACLSKNRLMVSRRERNLWSGFTLKWGHIAAVLLLIPSLAFAQSSSTLSDVVGVPSDASIYPIPGLGFVNLKNGNLHIQIPIRTVRDRNGSPITTNITYDNSIWYVGQTSGPNGNPVSQWSVSSSNYVNNWVSSLGFNSTPSYVGQISVIAQPYQCGSSQITQYTGFKYIDGQGTIHPFQSGMYTENGGTTACPTISEVQGPATDGSGYWLLVTNYSNAAVYDMHGNIVTGVGTTDANGNHNPGGFNDKLGRTTFPLAGFTSASQTIHVWSDFGYAGVQEIGDPSLGPDSASVMSSLTLPDGRKYSFQYDDAGSPAQQGHYGSLTGITLPTGGHISIVSEALPVADYTSFASPFVVKQITTPDGTWNFGYTSSLVTVTAPTDPATGLASQTTCTIGENYTVSTYAGTAAGTPLRTVAVQYQGPGQASSVTTTWNNAQSSHVNYTYEDLCTPRVHSKKEYGFSGTLVRETDVSYFTNSTDDTNLCQSNWTQSNLPTWSTPYLKNNHHIIDIPQSVTVYGPSGSGGAPVAQTNFTYDSTPLSTDSGPLGNPVTGLTAIHDDANFGSSMTIRGNPTVVSQLTSSGAFITTNTSYYNILGELIQSVDGDGHSTYYDFTDSWNDASCGSTPVFGYSTEVTNALGQATKTTYNSCDGSVASVQDQNDINNGRKGTVYSYDGLQRITGVTLPDGGETTTSYGGSTVPEVITATTLAAPDPNIITQTTLDGMGRTLTTVLTTDPWGPDTIDRTYDSLGRLRSVSNRHRSYSSPSTDGITKYQYDALGRMTIQTQTDGHTLQWCYNDVANGQSNCTANRSSVTAATWVDYSDELGKHWQRQSDALGRLVSVMEPDAQSNVPSYETDYTYDAQNNLTLVDQYGGANGNSTYANRVRTFTYDGLSRLWCASNPETSTWNPATGTTSCPTTVSSTAPQGVTSYMYDAAGNVYERTDPRGVITNYGYDSLNRITSKTYDTSKVWTGVPVAATSNVGYLYDIELQGWGWTPQTSPSWPNVSQTNLVGRLSSVSVGSPGANAWTVYGYDQNGRTILKSECLPIDCGNNHHDMHYKYDLAGNLAFYDRGLDVARNSTYPNQGYYYGGFTEQYDGAGNLLAVTGDTAGTNTATNIWSNPDYFPTGQPYTVLGLGLYNLKYSVAPRGWVTGQLITNATGTSIWQSSASYNINGTISTTTDTHAGGWTFTYDNLNRIATANSPVGNIAYTTDPFGNKHKQTPTWGMAPSSDYGSPAATNGLIGNGLLYDLGSSDAGNVIFDGFHHYMYDAEGRLYEVDYTTATPTCFTYDGDGDRVAMTNCTGSGSTTGILSEYLYDFNHRLMAQINPTTSKIVRANIYAGSNYLAEDASDSFLTNSPTATQLRVTDQVGTLRGLWDLSGNLTGTCTLFPYGDPNGNSCTVTPSAGIFTDKDRDAVSDLDNFGARYYSSTMGRFVSPDYNGDDDYVSPIPYSDLSNPQTLNLYSYTGNNPLTNVDPDGHDCIYAGGGGSGYEVVRGDCISDTDRGVYVNGTVTSANYNASNHSIGYTYTAYDTGNLGAGTIANVPAPQPMDEGAVTPGDNGLGLIVGGMATDYVVGRVLGSIFGRGAGEVAGAGAGRAASVDVTNLSAKIVKDMARRGWTADEITQTVENGTAYAVKNKATGGGATEFINPANGKFVVVDNATRQVLQVSGPGFSPNHLVP